MKGSCLCGAVEITAPESGEVSLCHCTMCRRWTGGPMFAVHVQGDVRFSGAEPVTYRSSDWAERGFCPACGTHLFYRLIPANEYMLSAGVFQAQDFRLTSQIFIDEKPDFYHLGNDTPVLTGQQVFEQFSSHQD